MSYEVPLQEGPILCPYCQVEADFVDSSVVYGGCSFGMIYLCPNWPECDARACAAGEGRPIGTLARKELRDLRRTCHHHFDSLWKGDQATMTRDEAYAYLQKIMRLERPEEAHFGVFDEAHCRSFLRIWNCDFCREMAEQGEVHYPSHNGSSCCRNMRTLGVGAIAAGGTRAHCTCSGCF